MMRLAGAVKIYEHVATVDGRWTPTYECARFDQDIAMDTVESIRTISREFQMLALIFTYRHMRRSMK